MNAPHRKHAKAAPSWGSGFDRLGLPQNGRRSLPWWISQSYLPFLRDDG